MGKKRAPFIDRKNARTYSLAYADDGDEDGPPGERVLVPAGAAGGPGAAADDGPPDARSFWARAADEEAITVGVKDRKRQEIVDLGLPDDGYDYTKHLRHIGPTPVALSGLPAPGAPGASSGATAGGSDAPPGAPGAGAPGPAIFLAPAALLAPAADVRLVDARGLALAPAAGALDADEAELPATRVPVRERGAAARLRGTARAELEELAAMMRAAEEDEGGDAEGDGDLMDDFMLAACAAPEGGEEAAGTSGGRARRDAVAAAAADESDEDDDWGEEEEENEEEDEDEEESSSGGDGAAPRARGRAPLAVAAGPSAAARRSAAAAAGPGGAQLEMLNAKFGNLMRQYGQGREGDLEDGDGADGARNGADLSAYGPLLDAFLEENAELLGASGSEEGDGSEEGEGSESASGSGGGGSDAGGSQGAPRRGRPGRVERVHKPAAARKVEALAARDEEVIARTKRRGAALLAADEAFGGRDAPSDLERRLVPDEDLEGRWDCETILTTRSCVTHVPGTISEPGRPRRARPLDAAGGDDGAGGHIKLSRKTGLPAGYTGGPSSAAGGGAGGGRRGAAAMAAILERPADETPEEKKLRKSAVKEGKRSARAAKKELREAYGSEATRQAKQAAHSARGATMIIG